MYSETIGHGSSTYRIEVKPCGTATVSTERDGIPCAWGVPAGATLADKGLPRELHERIERRIADGRVIVGAVKQGEVHDEDTVRL